MRFEELKEDSPDSEITEWFSEFTVGDTQDWEEFLQRIPFRRVQRMPDLTPEDRQAAIKAATEMATQIYLGSPIASQLFNSQECKAYFVWLSLRRKQKGTKYESIRNLPEMLFAKLWKTFVEWRELEFKLALARLGNALSPSSAMPSQSDGADSTAPSPKPTSGPETNYANSQ